MSEKEKFEKWADSKGYYPHVRGDMWEGWQAALSTRKLYWYGIVDKDGIAVVNIEVNDDEEAMEDKALSLTVKYPEYGPFRVVELFYEDSES